MSWCFSLILKIENPSVPQCGACCCCDDSKHHTLSVINWSVKKYFQLKILSGKISVQLSGSSQSECLPWSFVTMQKHVMLLNMISLWIIYSIFARIHPLEQLRSQFKAVGLIENEMARLKGPSVRSSDFHPTHGAESGSADVFVNVCFQDNCAAIKGRLM